MPPPDRTAGLPGAAQKSLDASRRREAAFASRLGVPRGASAEEQTLHDRRVDIERTIASLFDHRDAARLAASYALDLDLDREASFIDDLLRDLPAPWLAPYLNLIAGHRKLCEGRTTSGRRQLAAARNGGHPLIRVAAELLLDSPTHQPTNSPTSPTAVRWCSPSP